MRFNDFSNEQSRHVSATSDFVYFCNERSYMTLKFFTDLSAYIKVWVTGDPVSTNRGIQEKTLCKSMGQW